MADDIDFIADDDDDIEEEIIEDIQPSFETDEIVSTGFINHVDETKKMGNDLHQPLTRRCLTKYEYARLIGVRASQIEELAPIYVDPGNIRDPIKIAMMEFEQGVLPLAVKRPLPGRDLHNPPYEICRLQDLIQH